MPRHDVVKSTESNDYYTPEWIFEKLNTKFDVDVAAPCGGVPWIPAAHSWCILNDGLQQNWYGRVWMNPPFSAVTEWAKKFMAHGNGIALLPMAKSLWFIDIWNEADAIMTLPSRLKFEHITKGTTGIYAQSTLVAMGEENVQILKASGINKVR